MTSSLSKSRRAIQWIGVAGAFLLGLRHVMPGEASRGGSFDSFCPFGGIETLLPYIATGQTLKTTNLLNFSILLGVLGVGGTRLLRLDVPAGYHPGLPGRVGTQAQRRTPSHPRQSQQSAAPPPHARNSR